MRSNITQAQITAMIIDYFQRQGSDVNFIYYGLGDDGDFNGALIDYDFAIELPEDAE